MSNAMSRRHLVWAFASVPFVLAIKMDEIGASVGTDLQRNPVFRIPDFPDFNVMECIAAGTNGDVFSAECTVDGEKQTVCIKQIPSDSYIERHPEQNAQLLQTDEERQYLKQLVKNYAVEAKIMSAFEKLHQNIMPLLGHYTNDHTFVMVMPMADMDLASKLKQMHQQVIALGSEESKQPALSDSPAKFSEDELLAMSRGLAGALRCMHNGGYVHRDLKPGHILLYDGLWRITDFGQATHFFEDHVRKNILLFNSECFH